MNNDQDQKPNAAGYDDNRQPQANAPQPNQQPYGYQQQPYGYQPQPNQQPYGYQQQPYGYQQQPNQQPYGYPPQQPYPVAVPAPAPAPAPVYNATEAEKKAVFSTGGSILMLILCIVASVNLVSGLIGDFLSLNIVSGLIGSIFDILTLIGMWLVFVNARKRKLNSTPVSLIRVPFIITFIFSVFGNVFKLAGNIITFRLISFVLSLLVFIFQCIYFGSVNKCLKMGGEINKDRSLCGKTPGVFAAVVTIIFASLDLIEGIMDYLGKGLFTALINYLLENMSADNPMVSMISGLVSGVGTMGLIATLVAFAVNILAAILIISFNKKLKNR